jgi:hypothetical protein
VPATSIGFSSIVVKSDKRSWVTEGVLACLNPDIPLHETAFSIEAPNEYEAAKYIRPDPLVMRRADDSIANVADIVEYLSVHFVAHKNEILEAKEPSLHVTRRPCT